MSVKARDTVASGAMAHTPPIKNEQVVMSRNWTKPSAPKISKNKSKIVD